MRETEMPNANTEVAGNIISIAPSFQVFSLYLWGKGGSDPGILLPLEIVMCLHFPTQETGPTV
jgi:hypothetical protein